MRLLSKILNFNTLDDLVLDTDKYEIVADRLQLKPINLVDQFFNQDFSSDTGFVYNNQLTRIDGGVLRQKDQRPVNATFAATFTSGNADAVWGGGSPTAALFGTPSPTISSGQVTLVNASQAVEWQVTDNFFPNQGCVRLRIKPNYSGTPATYQMFFNTAVSPPYPSAMELYQFTDGNLYLAHWDDTGVLHNVGLGVWSPISGTVYEIEIDYNFDDGATRVFIDGVQFGATIATVMTVNASQLTIFSLGFRQGQPTQNYSCLDIILFSEPQHTSSYTPGAVIPETIYAADVITLPTFAYAGPSIGADLLDFDVDESGTGLRYNLNSMYWDGDSWEVSNDTYSQMNPKATIVANIGTFPIADEFIVRIGTVDQNVQASADNLQITYTDLPYSADNPVWVHSTGLNTDALVSITGDEAHGTGTDIKYFVLVDSVAKYWNGSAWADSDQTDTQTNSLSQLNANLGELDLSDGAAIQIGGIFTSTGLATSSLGLLSISYDFHPGNPDELITTFVFGWSYDLQNQPREGLSVTVELQTQIVEGDTLVSADQVARTYTDVDGYWELELVSGTYMFNLDGITYSAVLVPEQDSISFTDLL